MRAPESTVRDRAGVRVLRGVCALAPGATWPPKGWLGLALLGTYLSHMPTFVAKK